MTAVMGVSERHACRVVGQHRSTQRRAAPPNPYRDRLVARMRELAVENPRRGRRYVMDLTCLVLAASGFLFAREVTSAPWGLVPYACYLAANACYILHCGLSYRRYRYRKQGWADPVSPPC